MIHGVVFYDTLLLLRALIPMSTRRMLKENNPAKMGISFTLGVAFEQWVKEESPAFIGTAHKADFDAFMTVRLYYAILIVLRDVFFQVK